VNQGLAKRFAGRSDVLVVDGFQVWQSVANPVFSTTFIAPAPPPSSWEARLSV
jgi:hypothetical protein